VTLDCTHLIPRGRVPSVNAVPQELWSKHDYVLLYGLIRGENEGAVVGHPIRRCLPRCGSAKASP